MEGGALVLIRSSMKLRRWEKELQQSDISSQVALLTGSLSDSTSKVDKLGDMQMS